MGCRGNGPRARARSWASTSLEGVWALRSGPGAGVGPTRGRGGPNGPDCDGTGAAGGGKTAAADETIAHAANPVAVADASRVAAAYLRMLSASATPALPA